MRYAIVSAGIVQQIILWDGVSGWTPPNGSQAIACDDTTQIGAAFDGKVFIAPPQVTSRPDVAVAEVVGADNLTDSERATFKMLAAKVAG